MAGFTIFGRLAALELCNEAETGSRFRITADVVASSSFAPQVALTHVESASWRTSNSHGQFLSTDKVAQTYLAHQRHKGRKEKLIIESSEFNFAPLW